MGVTSGGAIYAGTQAGGPGRYIRRMRRTAVSVLYPPRCALCDGLLGGSDRMLCRACRTSVPFLTGPLCCRCGRPLAEETDEFCAHCGRTRHLFTQGFAPFAYDGHVREALMRFKYGHRAEYAAFFAHAMREFGYLQLRAWMPQLLVPVPVHRERLIRRGYNQAACLAQALSRETGIPVLQDGLRRIRGTMPQKELSERQRRRNLRGAFRLTRETVLPERVLIVDDIYTTGSTADAAAAFLLRGGAREVYVACASVAVGM